MRRGSASPRRPDAAATGWTGAKTSPARSAASQPTSWASTSTTCASAEGGHSGLPAPPGTHAKARASWGGPGFTQVCRPLFGTGVDRAAVALAACAVAQDLVGLFEHHGDLAHVAFEIEQVR